MATAYGKRILGIMQELGYSQADVSKGIGIKQPSLSYLIKNTNESKHNNTIADFLGVNTHWLATGKGERRDNRPTDIDNINEPPATWTKAVPVISWVQAGDFTEAVDIHEPGFADTWIPPRPKKRMAKNEFALVVEGDSMTNPINPSLSFPKGGYIYINPDDKNPTDGQFVVAKLNGDSVVTFKQFKIEDGKPYLNPLNPNFKPIFQEFSVLGRVVGSYYFKEL